MLRDLFIISVVLITGCSTIAENYRTNPILTRSVKNGEETYYSNKGEAININSAAFLKKINSIGEDKKHRNQFIRELMDLSDNVCELHEATIISNSNTWNIATGSISNILSGFGSVVGGEATKSALSAGAALSNSTRSLINEEIYTNALATTIVRAIRVKRNEAKISILKNLGESAKNYPTWSAIYDVAEYHRRCSFISGMVEITKALENRKESTEEINYRIQLLRNQISENKNHFGKNYKPGPNLKSRIEALQTLLFTAPLSEPLNRGGVMSQLTKSADK